MAEAAQGVCPVEEYKEMSDEINAISDGAEEDDDSLLLVPPEPIIRQRHRWMILPEVPTLLFFLALVTQYPVVQFWLVDHFSQEYNWTTQGDVDYCARNSSQTNSSGADLENKVQAQSNKYFMYMGFISSFTAILPTLFLGALTDKFGRKFVFYISFLGLFGSQLLTVMVFLYDLTPGLLFLSSFMQGLSGSYGLFLAAVFGVVADITSPGKQRAVRVAVLEAVIAVAMSVGTTTSGLWVKKMGYVWPVAFSMGEIFIATLFVLFLIPETLAEKHGHPFSCKTILKCFEFYVKDTPSKRRFKLIVSLVCFMTILGSIVGESNFGLLFLLHRPFCWPKVQITVFNGLLTLAKWVMVMGILLVAKRCISEPAFAMIGSVSSATGFLLKGLARSNLLIFVGKDTMVYSIIVFLFKLRLNQST